MRIGTLRSLWALAAWLTALAIAGAANAEGCVDEPLRMAEGFQANIVECAGSYNQHFVAVRADHFNMHLEAYTDGNFWYKSVKAYFNDAPMFENISNWGDESDADRRFNYATFSADFKNDDKGMLSCFGVTRHSSPYEGRGVIVHNLLVGVYCDDSYGDQPVPEARIFQVIDAIEFDFE